MGGVIIYSGGIFYRCGCDVDGGLRCPVLPRGRLRTKRVIHLSFISIAEHYLH
jgi:hypothetical protein